MARRNVTKLRLDTLAAHPGLQTALDTDHRIVADIKARFSQYGTLSAAQIALVLKLATQAAAPKVEETRVEAPVGRVEFTGTVVSDKERPGFRGGYERKLTIKVESADGSYLVWMTLPRTFARVDNAEYTPDNFRGYTLTATATLTRSDRDTHFAFGKRPSGVELQAVAAPAPAPAPAPVAAPQPVQIPIKAEVLPLQKPALSSAWAAVLPPR